jgi:hypothetical protein
MEPSAGQIREACEALSEWSNERALDPIMLTTPESFACWEIGPVEDWLVFSSPGGYTNSLYLVRGRTVYPFSYSTESLESALKSARASEKPAWYRVFRRLPPSRR